MKKKAIFDYIEKNCKGTVLNFPNRDFPEMNLKWGSSNYRGNFSAWVPATLIYRYNAKSVSEIFAGSGTTSDLCKDLEIPYVGIDLNPNPVRNDIISMDIMDYERDLPNMFYMADLQVLHPPYPSINGIFYANSMYSADEYVQKKDIQQMSWEEGMQCINRAIMRGYAAMPAGSYQAYVIGDVRRKVDGKSIFRSMLNEVVVPGKLEQLLIKIQNNTFSGRNSNFSRKAPFFMIEHEWVVVVKKESGYEVMYIMPHQFRTDIRDSASSTWKDVVLSVMRNLSGTCSLDRIYAELEGHKKTLSNPNWKAKVRQILQSLVSSGLVKTPDRGLFMAA